MCGIFFAVLLLQIQAVLAKLGYVGCFKESFEHSSFDFIPGDYDASSITPLTCMHLCSPRYKYCLTSGARSCFCGNKVNFTSRINDSHCSTQWNKPRDGHVFTTYGGILYYAVYEFAQGVTGLTLQIPTEVALLSTTWISASASEGDGTEFRFQIDDEVVFPFSNLTSVPYVFREKGNHFVRITARNRFSSTASVGKMVKVMDMFEGIDLECPIASVPGQEITCKGVWNSARRDVRFHFGDGSYKNLLLETLCYRVGPKINQTQNFLEKDNISLGTVVLASAKIPENGQISHWEILASKAGKIRVQIFRQCRRTSSSLNSSHCSRSQNLTCDSLQFLCLSSKQCVPANSGQGAPYNCTGSRDDTTNLATTDYKLVAENVLDIPHPGYHIFTVPRSEQLTVNQKDIIGWTSEGGQLAYTNTPESNMAFEFPVIGPPGSKISGDSSTRVHILGHALCAHLRQSVNFELKHTYTHHGMYKISSASTPTMSINVDQPITPFELRLPRLLSTNTTIRLGTGDHNGSSVTYHWNFGDGFEMNSTIANVTYAYRSPGLYTITVLATNAVSNHSSSSTLEVLDPIRSCRLTRPITAVILGKPVLLELKCMTGHNVTFSVNFGDGSTKELHSKSNEFIGNTVWHMYLFPGNFSVRILVFSPVGPNSSIVGQVVVEIPISGLQVRMFPETDSGSLYIGTSTRVTLERVFLHGTHATCIFYFGDSSPPIVTKRSKVNYTYYKPGTYHVNVTCQNHVSSVWKPLNISIVVETIVPLKNISLSVHSTVLGTPSVYTLLLSSGNLFTCSWDFGDGHTYETSFPPKDTVLSHSYDEFGTYTVNVTCRNSIGYSSATVLVDVDKPIRNATIMSKYTHARVNQSVEFLLAWMKGTRVSYCTYCNDTSSNSSHVVYSNLTMVTIKHVFSKPGRYPVEVRLWNSVSSSLVTSPRSITVENPVNGVHFYSTSPSRCASLSMSFCLNFSADFPQPTNASAILTFGDGTHRILRNLDVSRTICVQKYDYPYPGIYEVAVNVSNHVSTQFLRITANVKRTPLKGISPIYSNGSTFQRGMGFKNQNFPSGRTLKFLLSVDRDDLGFGWKIGDQTITETTGNIMEHYFASPGCYNVTAVVKNSKLQEFCVRYICVQEELKEIYLNVEKPTYFKDETVFAFWKKNPNAVSCFELSLGDNTTVNFGDASCGFLYRNLTSYAHLYKARGNYTVSLVAWNNVSALERSVTVEVWDEACSDPKVYISGGGPRHRPLLVRNLKEIVLEPVISEKCHVAEVMIIFWEVYIVNHEDEKWDMGHSLWARREVVISRNSTDEYRNAHLAIFVRSLPTEFFMVKLSVSFNGTERDLSHVGVSNYTWFDVSRSPLVARIKGGISYSVSWNTSLVLDGSESYDPDNIFDSNSLKFSWSCRPLNTSISLRSNTTSDTPQHCFKNISRIFSNSRVIKLSPGELLSPQIDVFSLQVEEGKRKSVFEQTLFVVDGPVPSIDLRCKVNCEQAVDPSQRLILESKCSNCERNTRIMYQWSISICSTSNSNATSLCKQLPNFGPNTSTGLHVANLAVLPNVLKIAAEYRVRCSARRPGSILSGFVEYLFKVNSPPSGGHCVVLPTQGYAVVTAFNISCFDWFDLDGPLMYLIETKISGQTLLLYSGNLPNMTIFLPSGEAENNFTIEVIVKVQDSMLFSSNIVHPVRVLESELVDYKQVVDDLEKVFEQKESKVGFGMVISLCSILNHKFNLSRQNVSKAKQTRMKIAEILSGVNASSFDEVRSLSDSLRTLSTKPEEINPETQTVMIKTIQSKMNVFYLLSETSRDIVGISTCLHEVMSNIIETALLESAGNTSGPTVGGNTTSNRTESAPSMVRLKERRPRDNKDVLSTIDQINNVVLSQIVADDRPAVIKTTNFNVHSTRKSLEGLSGSNKATSAFKVELQESAAFLENNNLTRLSVLGFQVTELQKFPGIYDSSAAELNSNVLRMNMENEDGSPVDLVMLDVDVIAERKLDPDEEILTEINTLVSEKTMKIHTFNRTIEDTTLVLKLDPVDASLKLRAYLSSGSWPTIGNHEFHADFPIRNTTSGISPYTWILSHDLLRNFSLPDFQRYFLGVKVLDRQNAVNLNYTLRIFWAKCLISENGQSIWWSKRCKIGIRTTLRQTHCICRPGLPDVPSQSQLRISRAQHSAPNPEVPKSAETGTYWRKGIFKISVGAAVFPVPNKIDFKHVFDEDLNDNPLALIAVMTAFGIFLILLVYARRQDRKDSEKVGVTPLLDNNPNHKYFYEVTLYTGCAGTTANVSIILSDQEGDVHPRTLYHPTRQCFQSGGIDSFLVSSPHSIGRINYIQIWHDNSGSSPSWMLEKVLIRDLNNKKTYLFPNNAWLAVEKGQGTVQTTLFPLSSQEMTEFKLLFNTTTRRNLKDRHLWFSVFMRPVDSRFTRVQRLSCCLTLLYSTMLVNAMFYQGDNANVSESTVTIGPFRLGVTELITGILSALIIFPLNAFIVWIFRNVESKPSADDIRARKEKSTMCWFYELFFCCFKSRGSGLDPLKFFTRSVSDYLYNSDSIDQNLEDHNHQVNSSGADDVIEDIDVSLHIPQKQTEKMKTSVVLPYCYIYIAWFSLALVSLTCAFFIVLYGLQFKRDVTASWLSSMTVSCVQDIFISEPLKVFAIAMVVALIIKKPHDVESTKQHEERYQEYEQWSNINKDNDINLVPSVKLPDKKVLEKAREKRLKELEMWALLKEIGLYVLFLLCLSTVTYKNKNPMSFEMNKVMMDVFVTGAGGTGKQFEQISNLEEFFTWANGTLLDGLYSSSLWYNQKLYREGLGTIAHGNLYVIGKVRIRQTRVRKNSCSVQKYFREKIKECHGWYSSSNKDTGCYGVGWTPITNVSLCNPSVSSKDPWKFFSPSEYASENSKFTALTHDEGFVVELSRSKITQSWETLAFLRAHNWFDARTREISIEINVYNGALNLFCLGKFTINLGPTNGITKHSSFFVTKLFALRGVLDTFSVISHIFIFIFFLMFIYREAKAVYRLKKKYFSNFWNLLQCFIVLLISLCILVFFLRLSKVEHLLTSLEENGSDVITFDHVAAIDRLLSYLIAFVVFLSWIRMIKLLRFNRRLSLFQETLKKIAKPLTAFSVVFFTLFVAYIHCGYLVFSRKLATFRDISTTFVSLFSIFMGHFDFLALECANRIIGPIFLFSAMFFGVFIIVNLLIALILEAFTLVKADATKKENQYELLEFIAMQLYAWMGWNRTQAPHHGNNTGRRRSSSRDELRLESDVEKNEDSIWKRTDESVSRLENMVQSMLEEDWKEEMVYDEFFLMSLGRVRSDWSNVEEDGREFEELQQVSHEELPGYSQELGTHEDRKGPSHRDDQCSFPEIELVVEIGNELRMSLTDAVSDQLPLDAILDAFQLISKATPNLTWKPAFVNNVFQQ